MSGPRCVSAEGKPLLGPQPGPGGPPPMHHAHGGNLRLSNSIGAFADPSVSTGACFNPMESQAGPHMIQPHCHTGGVHSTSFPTPQHQMHSGHQLSAAGFPQGMATMYKPPPEQLYGAQVPFQNYIPGPSMSSDIFTQPLPCDDNSWSHGSGHSCNMAAPSNPLQSMSGAGSMSNLSSMGHGSLLHGSHGSLQGHSSLLSNPGSIANPNASFPPPGLNHCSAPRPPPQAPWPQMQTRVSATGTVTSTNTSGLSSDVRLSSGLQQHGVAPSPPLPPGFQYAGKGSRQLLIHFSIASHGEVPSINSYMSGIASQLDGIESCMPISSPNQTLAVCNTALLCVLDTTICVLD